MNFAYLRVLSIAAIIFVSIIISTLNDTKAYDVDPNSGSYVAGETITIEILADPPSRGTDTGVTVFLDVIGGTVVAGSFVEPEGNFTFIQEQCESQTSFTTQNQVCVTLAKGVPLNNGESLGTFDILIPPDSTSVILSANSGSVYIDGVNENVQSIGQKASFTVTGGSAGSTDIPQASPTFITGVPGSTNVVASPTSTLSLIPNTSEPNNLFILILGFMISGLGIVLFIISRKAQK